MITSIRHIGIVSKNLERSLSFYCDLLGFEVIKRMGESGEYIDRMLVLEGVKVTTVKMAASDGNLIELLSFHSHKGEQECERKLYDIGISHLALTVDDLDYVYQKLISNGVTFNAPPQPSPDGYAKVTFCMDPDGNFIELVEVLKNNE